MRDDQDWPPPGDEVDRPVIHSEDHPSWPGGQDAGWAPPGGEDQLAWPPEGDFPSWPADRQDGGWQLSEDHPSWPAGGDIPAVRAGPAASPAASGAAPGGGDRQAQLTQQADEIRQQALNQADAIRQAAEREAAEIRWQAARQAEQVRQEQRRTGQIREQAAYEARQIRQAAARDADDLRAGAMQLSAELGQVAAYVTSTLIVPAAATAPVTAAEDPAPPGGRQVTGSPGLSAEPGDFVPPAMLSAGPRAVPPRRATGASRRPPARAARPAAPAAGPRHSAGPRRGARATELAPKPAARSWPYRAARLPVLAMGVAIFFGILAASTELIRRGARLLRLPVARQQRGAARAFEPEAVPAAGGWSPPRPEGTRPNRSTRPNRPGQRVNPPGRDKPAPSGRSRWTGDAATLSRRPAGPP
jgi:hypothetical protein